TATRGDRGRHGVHPFGSPGHPGADALAAIRVRELRDAARELGIGDVVVLEYGDGRLDQASPQAVIDDFLRELRRVRPHVVLPIAPDGVHGHPDHIAASQFATAAVVAASDPSRGAGIPHLVSKLYQLAWRGDQADAFQSAFKKLVSTVDGVERRPTPWPDWAV